MKSLRDLRRERDELRAKFDAAGGRGVELADEIDKVEATITTLEEPLTLKDATEIVLQLAEKLIEEHDYPDTASIADTDALRIAYIDQAIAKVKAHVKSCDK